MSKKAAIFFSIVWILVLAALIFCERTYPTAGYTLFQSIFG